MINKIICSTFFVLLLLSISLYLAGVREVSLGSEFLTFIKLSSIELEQYKLSIPDIPKIPVIEEATGFQVAVNGIVWFLNQLVSLLNFVVLIVNTLIQLIEFVVILIKNFINLRNNVIANQSA